MKNRFFLIATLVIVLLGECFNASGENLCPNDPVKTKTSSPNKDEFPGMESFEVKYNKGKNHESKFSIPCNFNDTYEDGHGANGNHVTYSVFTNKENVTEFTESELRYGYVDIYISRSEFKARGNHKKDRHYTSSVIFQDLELTSSIEWSADKNSWFCADNLVAPKLKTETAKGNSYNVTYSFAGENNKIKGS